MMYSLEKRQNVPAEQARENLEFLLKIWIERGIYDHSKAIQELNGLDEASRKEIKQKMVKALIACLPEVEQFASIIIEGMCRFDSQPFQEYMSKFFKGFLRDLVFSETKKKADLYFAAAADFIKQEKLAGKLGDYFFVLKKMSLEVSALTSLEYELSARSEFEPKVQLSSDKSIKDVAKDEVNLSAHLADRNYQYHQLIARVISQNKVDEIYSGFMLGKYRFEHLQNAIGKLSLVLASELSGKKAA